MADHCISLYPYEACGILAGIENRAEDIYPVKNMEPSPVSYLMDTADQFRILKEIRAADLRMIAIFHSHPASQAYPSPKDVELAFYDDVFYIIVGLLDKTAADIRVFRIVDGNVEEAVIRPAD